MLKEIGNTGVKYHFVCFDKEGVEKEQYGALGSTAVLAAVSREEDPVTDVFFVCHGWKGDRDAALEQCDAWIGQMARMADDRGRARVLDEKFNSLTIGLHWPSQAWGNERENGYEAGLLSSSTVHEADVKKTIKEYADALGIGDDLTKEVSTIVRATAAGHSSKSLGSVVKAAYRNLVEGLNLESDEGDEARKDWDPQKSYNSALKADVEEELLGGSTADFFLAPLRQLTFWTMKARARTVGESGVAALVRDIQAASDKVRIHLMGHSFGCIVVSAAVAGEVGKPLLRPVNSMFLVQGALSLWAYSQTLKGKAGYFRRIVQEGMVGGPIVTTWSVHDKAVGNLYPLAARIARQDTLDTLPRYGGTGAFGLQGPTGFADEFEIGGSSHTYDFLPGKIYNINSGTVIAKTDGLSGAHSDIVHPEVAHAAWSSILCGMTVTHSA